MGGVSLTSSAARMLNPLSANPTKWSNTLKQFEFELTNCLNVFDCFARFTKGLKNVTRAILLPIFVLLQMILRRTSKLFRDTFHSYLLKFSWPLILK